MLWPIFLRGQIAIDVIDNASRLVRGAGIQLLEDCFQGGRGFIFPFPFLFEGEFSFLLF